MKRLLSLIIVTTLLLSIGVAAANAEGSGPAPEKKINAALRERMDQVADDKKIGVWAWGYDLPETEIDQLIAEKYGEDYKIKASTEEYRKARFAVLEVYYTDLNRSVIDRLGVDEADIRYVSMLMATYQLRLTKAQIIALSEMEEVYEIDLYETGAIVDDDTAKHCKYLDAYNEWFDRNRYIAEVWQYRELYTENDADGQPLWAIIFARDNISLCWDVRSGGIVGNRLISDIDGGGIFCTGYGLYDIRQDEFYDLARVKASEYPGLCDALDALHIGNPIGDVDFDKDISILDATKMQRIIAELEGFDGYGADGEFSDGFSYRDFADFNRDKSFDIIDATAVQRMLAGLDE